MTEYVFAGGAVTKRIYKYDPTDMSKVGESGVISERISYLDKTDTDLVVGITGYLKLYDPNDLSSISITGVLFSTVGACCWDGTYVYGGLASGVLHQFDPDTLASVDNYNYGDWINALLYADGLLYAAGDTTRTVHQIDPSDMSKIAESIGYGGDLYALAWDGTYIYAGGYTTLKVWQLDPEDMSKVAESNSFGATTSKIIGLAYADGVMYTAGYTYLP